MVPCSNNHIDWVEILLINESHGDFTSCSCQQSRIGCLSVPHMAGSSGVHVCPIWSDQFLVASKRESIRSEMLNRSWERYHTIGVHLAENNDVTQLQCQIHYYLQQQLHLHNKLWSRVNGSYTYKCKVYFTYNMQLHTEVSMLWYTAKVDSPEHLEIEIHYSRTDEWKAARQLPEIKHKVEQPLDYNYQATILLHILYTGGTECSIHTLGSHTTMSSLLPHLEPVLYLWCYMSYTSCIKLCCCYYCTYSYKIIGNIQLHTSIHCKTNWLF